MKSVLRRIPVWILFRKLRWYLTLSFNLATLAAIFLLGWWGLVVGTIYLHRSNPALTWSEILSGQVLPALRAVLPSALVLIIPALLVSAYFGFLSARWLDIRLSNLRKATQAWKEGNFSVVVQDDVQDEIGSFGQELNGMAKDLESLLQVKQNLAVLEERNRLARDLHDSVKQQITAASFQIEAAKVLLDRDPGATRDSLVEAGNLAHEAHQELNSMIYELRPAAHETREPLKALRDYVNGWARQNHLEARVQIHGDWNTDPAVQLEVFRFVQEALSNIARHSQATLVHVSLAAGPREMSLSIQDNGCGFEPELAGEKGFGLKTMRERISQVGGRLSIESHPLKGTQIHAQIPNLRKTDG